MDKIKNLGVLIFSFGIGLILLYFLYHLIVEFVVSDTSTVVIVAVSAIFLGLVIVMVQLIYERMKDSKKEKKSLKE